jgi:hypothetical protein
MSLERIRTMPTENLLDAYPRKSKYQSICTHSHKIASFETIKIYSCAKVPHFVEDNGVDYQIL